MTGAPGVSILHRGEGWVAVDKPAGLFVHRTRLGPERDVLLQRLRDALGGQWVSPVHRLDRPTSGVVLFGFDGDVVRRLQAALARSTTMKLYVALVRGQPEDTFVIDRPLSSERGEAREARTEGRRLATFEDGRLSLVVLRLCTGRRHQLRRHLGGKGHHVLGDVRYGKGRINRRLREEAGLHRMALHAWRLDLDLTAQGTRGVEASEGDTVRIEAPLGEDLLRPLQHWIGADELADSLGSMDW